MQPCLSSDFISTQAQTSFFLSILKMRARKGNSISLPTRKITWIRYKACILKCTGTPNYRVTHLDGYNLPLTSFLQFGQVVGRRCSSTYYPSRMAEIPKSSQREV